MPSLNEYIAGGHGWLFFPMAVFLGALHGLEPGHSKTMMTAFIVAIRGTVGQAILLGVSATISHTAIIWILAVIGLHYSSSINVEELEPYFQLAAGLIVIGLACWMLYQTRRAQMEAHAHEYGPHDGIMIDTGHGFLEISVFETNVPPRFRIYLYDSHRAPVTISNQQTVTLETVRSDGSRQLFSFLSQGSYLEAKEHLPEPHEFQAVVELKHGDHGHVYKVNFSEDHHSHGVDLEFGDAHERAHAEQLQKHLANTNMTTRQIILFGLTGGLLPCPSALAVLLLCLQLKKVTLGFMLVLGFSLGLAVTLVTVGVIAAVSVDHASKKFKTFGEWGRKMPYVSSSILIAIGVIVTFQGLHHLILN